MCLKGSCDTLQPIGVVLGLIFGVDEALKNTNREPVFGPLFGTA